MSEFLSSVNAEKQLRERTMSKENVNIRLVVRCYGLILSKDAKFRNGGGISNMFSNMFTTNNSSNRSEKRQIRISQSEPFQPGGRPKSFNYESIYESEIFENKFDVYPSLVAEINCPEDKDCNLRIGAYYNSNLTGGKFELLCQTTITVRELKKQIKGVYAGTMQSEYCFGARLYLEIVESLNSVLNNSSFSCNTPPKTLNPLFQNYVFYSEDDYTTRNIDVEEYCWEPRLTSKVPEVFLKNFKKSLLISQHAWEQRRKFEEIRQGRFKSKEDAFKNNWVEIEINVLEAHTVQNSCLQDTTDKSTRIGHTFVSHTLMYSGDDQGMSLNELNGSRVANTKNLKKKIDPLKPTTYVDISVEDTTQTFLYHIGRTNTEYNTFNPVFGSNINAPLISKPQIKAIPSNPTLLNFKEKTFIFQEITDTVEKDLSITTEQQNILNISGVDNVFKRYIPQTNESSVRFDVVVEDYVHGKHMTRKGVCHIPLSDKENLAVDMWVPVLFDQSEKITSSFLEFLLHVKIKVTTAQNERSTFIGDLEPFLSKMDETRKPFTQEERRQKNLNGKYNDNINYTDVICNCYDWQWQLGYNGDDPMLSNTIYDSRKKLPNYSTIKSEAVPKRVQSYNINSNESSVSFDLQSKLNRNSTLSSSSTLSDNLSIVEYAEKLSIPDLNESSSLPSENLLYPRTDLSYSLQWIDEHIVNLIEFGIEVNKYLTDLKDLSKDIPCTFRASVFKKEMRYQMLPINFHFQLMVIKNSSSHRAIESIVDSVTCGSLSPHGLGHKKGGLLELELKQNLLKKNIDSMKEKFQHQILHKGPWSLPTSGNTYKLLEQINESTMIFENTSISISKRKLLSISQGLTVVINSFIMKLQLVAEEKISIDIVEKWVKHGFLIVFEGLLSMSGSEKSMLEDTQSAIQALKKYEIRILPTPLITSSKSLSSDNIRCQIDLNENIEFDQHKIDIDMNGRDVILYFPEKCFEKLPSLVKENALNGGTIVKIVPILFTQGIDLQETTATMFSNGESTIYQRSLNYRGYTMLNEYCYETQPIFTFQRKSDVSSLDEHNRLLSLKEIPPHPLISSLHDAIITNGESKNVDMLLEVERVCTLLDGCRVTFCKSGKDRTGMAVTFEQARQLGERFRCGNNINDILKNANLMRVYGTRIQICSKNIGKPIYSINSLQAKFLPPFYRPPESVCENIIKGHPNLS